MSPTRSLTSPFREIHRVSGVEGATRRALLYFVLPLWPGSGVADWWHHRRTRIEDTAGARESTIHLLMLAEAGVPALLGLFLEVNAGVLLTAFGAMAAHEVTAIWDVVYAEPRRKVTPSEQHVHSLRLKKRPLGPKYVVALLVAIALAGIMPYVEELWRCWRANPTLEAQPVAASGQQLETR